MSYELSKNIVGSDFADEVSQRSGQDIFECYQCGKCTAGCPLQYQMDLQPNQIIRLVQLGMREKVFNSKSIWLCISCETCTTRCPREVDLAHVLDTLRSMVYTQKSRESSESKPIFKDFWSNVYKGLIDIFHMGTNENVRTFNSVFLENVRRQGRSFEMSLIGGSNTGTGFLFRNILKAPLMAFKGKIHLKPEKMSKVRKEKLERMFTKVEKMENSKI